MTVQELMVVDGPDFTTQSTVEGETDARKLLRNVYRSYGFRTRGEIPEGKMLVVATQAPDETEPKPVSREDYLANALDPVGGKAARGTPRSRLRRARLLNGMIVFYFERV